MTITGRELQTLWKYNLQPAMMSHTDAALLRNVLDEMVTLLDEVKSKEAKLKLAQKVLEEAGDNTGVERFTQELFDARQDYAKFMLQFNHMRHYPQPVLRGYDGKIVEASEGYEDERLRPVEETDLTKLLAPYGNAPVRFITEGDVQVVSIQEEDEWIEIGRLDADRKLIDKV